MSFEILHAAFVLWNWFVSKCLQCPFIAFTGRVKKKSNKYYKEICLRFNRPFLGHVGILKGVRLEELRKTPWHLAMCLLMLHGRSWCKHRESTPNVGESAACVFMITADTKGGYTSRGKEAPPPTRPQATPPQVYTALSSQFCGFVRSVTASFPASVSPFRKVGLGKYSLAAIVKEWRVIS